MLPENPNGFTACYSGCERSIRRWASSGGGTRTQSCADCLSPTLIDFCGVSEPRTLYCPIATSREVPCPLGATYCLESLSIMCPSILVFSTSEPLDVRDCAAQRYPPCPIISGISGCYKTHPQYLMPSVELPMELFAPLLFQKVSRGPN